MVKTPEDPRMMNATIQIRTDAELKKDTDSILNQLGLTLSEGINIFLRQVKLNGGLPFEVKLGKSSVSDNTNELTETHNQTVEERLAQVRSLCGAFKDCSFSTERLSEMNEEDKKLEEEKHGRVWK
jgi:addiction module RelB/DinJ family antitoxin